MIKRKGKKGMKGFFLGLTILAASLSFSGKVEAQTCEKHELKDAREIAGIIDEGWEDDYFQEIVVNKYSNTVEIDGEKNTFTRTFSASSSEMKEAVSSQEKLERFLEEKEDKQGLVYQVDKGEKGSFLVSAPYQTKRIVIQSAQVKDDYGACDLYVYEDGQETILVFETEEETQEAYEKIKKKYGEKNCYVDEIVSSEDILQGTAACYSWGGSYMGMSNIRLDSSLASKGKVTVAIIDSGINTSSPIFNGTKILSTKHNFIDNNSNVSDGDGHGTHVAGIIANLTPDNVQLLILKVLNNNGEGSRLSFEAALKYAIDQNVDVINLSAGFSNMYADGFTFLDNVINNAYKKGIPIVTAAGNSTYYVRGNDVSKCYPACNTQTVTVSALDKNSTLADYSFYGSAIDFAAPGTEVYSASLSSNKVVAMSGTSMAAPHITAALAYVKMMNRSLSVDGCCMELRQYCKDLGPKGWDVYYGYGCPNIGKMFENGQKYSDLTISQNPSATTINCANVSNGVAIRWKKVANATGYYIYRKAYGCSDKKIATVKADVTSMVDTAAKEGDYNLYYVVAYRSKNGSLTQSARSNYIYMAVLRPIKLNKVKALGKKKVRITRNNGSYYQGERMQVQYSKNKAFTNSTTKSYKAGKTIQKVKFHKKGTYYVRIRRSLKFNNVTYYSAWSNVKKVKVK